MISLFLFTLLSASATQILPLGIDPAALAQAKVLYAQQQQFLCEQSLSDRAARLKWLDSFPPDHQMIFSPIQGSTLALAEVQSVLDATYFSLPGARPVMVSGIDAEGKTLHLEALARYLRERSASVFALWKLDPDVYVAVSSIGGRQVVRYFASHRRLPELSLDLIDQISAFAKGTTDAFVILDFSQILQAAEGHPNAVYQIADFLERLDQVQEQARVHLLISMNNRTIRSLDQELSARAFANVTGRYLRLDLSKLRADPFADFIDRLIPREFRSLIL